MVKLDQVHERLLGIAQAGWQTPANHPDLIPAHEALLLREQFTEMLRNEEIALQPSDFQEMLRSSEQAARQLEILLVRPVASVSPWPQDATTDSLNSTADNLGRCSQSSMSQTDCCRLHRPPRSLQTTAKPAIASFAIHRVRKNSTYLPANLPYIWSIKHVAALLSVA